MAGCARRARQCSPGLAVSALAFLLEALRNELGND